MASRLWVLLLIQASLGVAVASTMWFHTGSDKKIKPVENFELSMKGYDVVLADPFESEDPGFREQIFEPLYKQDGRTYFYSFVDEVELNDECDMNLTFALITNSSELLREKFVDYSMFLDADRDEIHTSVLSTAAKQLKVDPWTSDVVIGRAKCATHSVKIAPFEKPVFTVNFQNALRVLHEATKDPTSKRSLETMLMFFLTYGTHFMKTTEMGSKIVLKTSAAAGDSNLTQKCLNKAMLEAVKNTNETFQTPASLMQKYFTKCSEHKNEQQSTLSEANNNVQLLTSGIFPHGNLKNWLETAKDSPFPIGAELVKLSYFFRDQWMDFLETNGTRSPRLDTEAMYELYESGLSYYCQKVIGPTCKIPSSKHTLRDTRAETENRVQEENVVADQPHIDFSLMKEETPKFNAVVVSGGFKGIHEALASIEIFSENSNLNLTLPDLPLKAGGHSLTSVGSILYNCGGSTPWSLSDMALQCHKLNITSSSPSWTPAFKLPEDMKTFHTSVSLASDIWFFDRGSFTVYIYHSNSDSFNQYFLPFLTNSEMCITKVGSSSIAAVDTKESSVFILNHPSDPQSWLTMPTLLETRYSPACVSVGSLIYITGDSRNEMIPYYEVFDFNLRQVHLIPTFNQSRIGYGLAVLDGAPIVLGGMVKVGKTILPTVEIYDSVQGKWKTHDRQLASPRTLFGLTSIVL